MKQALTRVADVFIERLLKAGVKRIYGVAGDSLNGLTDAVRAHDGIEWMMVRQEEGAAFAASGEGRMTGTPAVCAGAVGREILHLSNGLHDCQKSRVPVLAIATQVPSAEMGTSYFQETRPEHLFMTCSDLCEQIVNVEQVPRVGDCDADDADAAVRGVQQQRAGVCGAGDEGGGIRSLWDGVRAAGLCGDCKGGGFAGSLLKPEQLEPVLREALAHAGPVLIDVSTARQELSLSPTISVGQAARFNLYMTKAMLHGDGHEVLDRAKTNLRR